MPTEADLLLAIALNPVELDRWLILSDWLEDQADPRCDLARLRHLLHTEPNHPQVRERLARQMELLASGLAPVVPTRNDNALNMPLALVLPGTFVIGSPTSEKNRESDEVQHTVTLTQPFYLGVYPVTVGEFTRFVEASGYQTRAEAERNSVTWRAPGFPQTERHPVVCVCWDDAQVLVHWLNAQTGDSGLSYSLPTEARWEYACRAGTGTAFWWGNEADRFLDHAWCIENSGSATHPVETKKPNPWGFWHILGHVWEWCVDANTPYAEVALIDPEPANEPGANRIIRGGSWYFDPSWNRSANREHNVPGYHAPRYGMRVMALPRTR